MIAVLDSGWRFALAVHLRRVFSWHVQLAPNDDLNDVYAERVHLLRALDPAAQRVISLGLYDRQALADILARLPDAAYHRGEPLADIAPAQSARVSLEA